MVKRIWLEWLLVMALGTLPGALAAAVEISTGVDSIEGEGWRIGEISLRLQSSAAAIASVALEIEEIALPDSHGSLHGVELGCDSLLAQSDGWHCKEGSLRAQRSPVGTQETTWSGFFSAASDWEVEVTRLKLARGTVGLKLGARQGHLSADLRVYRLGVVPLAQMLETVELPPGWGVTGVVSGSIRVQADRLGPTGLYADLVLDELNYASHDGRNAAENVLLKLDASAHKRSAVWYFDAKLALPKGVVYAEPVFLDAATGGVTSSARGNWNPQRELLQLDAWSVEMPGVAGVNGTGRLRGADLAIEDLTIVARSDHAGSFYTTLLQPFLIGSAADDLEVQGSVGLVLHLDATGIEQAGLELNGLVLADRRGRYALGQTDGSVAWDRAGSVPVSRLQIQDARVYQIPTDGFSIDARFSGDGVRLERPVVVPVSGGEVRLDSFELSGILVAGDRPQWKADASVRDVSLEQLTTALDWPPFAGRLEGQLRDMRYSDQVFSVGGGLEVEAFGGSVMVRNLKIREPLGSAPILTAAAEFRGLSLLALTQTFSFGRIEGRLDGEINDIRLLAWQPDSFDMHLYTPEDDDLKHRISQRAVENLTEIGNGISAGLSTTFLRVFDEFRYDRIDLNVLLNGDVAELDGLARSDGGYYLVKGAGLPRIDVIGRNRSVAWKDLVERLRRIRVEEAKIQ
jgi:hypothetical protein